MNHPKHLHQYIQKTKPNRFLEKFLRRSTCWPLDWKGKLLTLARFYSQWNSRAISHGYFQPHHLLQFFFHLLWNSLKKCVLVFKTAAKQLCPGKNGYKLSSGELKLSNYPSCQVGLLSTWYRSLLIAHWRFKIGDMRSARLVQGYCTGRNFKSQDHSNLSAYVYLEKGSYSISGIRLFHFREISVRINTFLILVLFVIASELMLLSAHCERVCFNKSNSSDSTIKELWNIFRSLWEWVCSLHSLGNHLFHSIHHRAWRFLPHVSGHILTLFLVSSCPGMPSLGLWLSGLAEASFPTLLTLPNEQVNIIWSRF